MSAIVRVSVVSREESKQLAASLMARPGPSVVIIDVDYELEPGFCWGIESLRSLNLLALVIVTASLTNRWKLQFAAMLAQAPYPIEVCEPHNLTATLDRLGLRESVALPT